MDIDPTRGIADWIAQIESWSIRETIAIATFVGAIVVWFDVLTGPEISFSIFYVGPVAIIAERLGRLAGSLTAALAAAAWYVADIVNDNVYSQSLIPIWNGVVRFGFFAIVAVMTVALRDVVRALSDQARVDPLTSLLNRRGFAERCSVEFERARRAGHPITLAYLDLDGFKRINDTAGHAAGDEALRHVSVLASSFLRAADVVGRLGGDEFAFLLPDTATDAARSVVNRLHAALTEHGDTGIGYSFGVVTFAVAPPDIDAALEIADRLMYRTKSERPGGVHFETA